MTPEAFAAATDLFQEAALLLTRGGTVVAVNAAAAAQLGAPADALKGRALAEFVQSPTEALADYLRACARSKQVVPGAITLKGAGGQSAGVFRTDGRLVQPGNGGGEALVLVRLVPKEAAVTQFVALTERVEQLTREVGRRRLAEANLQEALRHKDEFLSLLAHELRNPLAAVLNGVELLRLRGEDEATRERAVEVIARQTRHLARMVDDLLDVARLTQGKIQLARQRADLGRLVGGVVEDHRAAFDTRGVTVAVAMPETPVWVNGDPVRLAQVVANLFVNAGKFTDPGGRVELRVVATREGRAQVSVRDTGVGLDPALLPHLFEPFAQADRTLDRARGGLGLGLAIAKGLAELHGGGVSAGSMGPGLGSEFTLWLPLGGEPAALAASDPLEPVGTGRRVLIIEDNRDAATSLQMLLEVLGHEVRIAYNGPDGVREAQAWRPEVVVCDIGLPGLDGYGVATELDRLSVRSTACLIALTGYGDEESRDRAARAGFHHHLTKPADPAALQKLLAG